MAIILTAVLLMSMCCVSAFAAEGEKPPLTSDGSMNIRSVSVEYTDGSKIDLEGENAHATVVNWR